ncbi:hypothetical protein V1477_013569 [Vespula maculifrons]|uniref:Uncharacterized protein n=1 Tax=Vespula maculifrons TaxID=7453 RepID=A0ABD2BPZ4_VESMC
MTVNPSIGYLEGIRIGVIEMKWWLGRKCLINLSFGWLGRSIGGCSFGIRRYVDRFVHWSVGDSLVRLADIEEEDSHRPMSNQYKLSLI